MRLKNFFKNEFLKNILTLLTGTFLGQAVSFLFIPVLTRLYSNELFGYYFIFISTINILSKFSTLRFELAIVLVKNIKIAVNALAVTFLILIATTSLILIFALILNHLPISNGTFKVISQNLFLIPAVLFLAGIIEIMAAWNNRLKKYKIISGSKIVNSTGIPVFQMLLKNLTENKSGLVIGYSLGRLLTAIYLLLFTLRNILCNLKYLRVSLMKQVLKNNRKIPLFNSLINVVNNISNEIPVYAFGMFYGASATGFYGMANKISGTPVDIIGRSVSQVYYQKTAEDFANNKSIYFFTKKLLKKLIIIGSGILIVYLLSLPLLHLILGNQWKGIEIYVLILLPSILVNFLVQPISSLYTVFNKQHVMIVFQIIFLLFKFAGIWLGYLLTKNIFISLAILTTIVLVYKIFILTWYLKLAKNE